MSFQAHEDPVCTLTGNDTYLFSGSLKSIKVSALFSHLLLGSPTVRAHCNRCARLIKNNACTGGGSGDEGNIYIITVEFLLD